ncbi:hypothetical protein [Iamia sp.]|uniref:hypothetical protein n=1 Tax=Iamia sp. TaxID=2722710 RepID=UPI002BA70C64|nr:hypothetical protein [Iamia sp.]HXH56284.1 hypothetical protein [Iamia sp.]
MDDVTYQTLRGLGAAATGVALALMAVSPVLPWWATDGGPDVSARTGGGPEGLVLSLLVLPVVVTIFLRHRAGATGRNPGPRAWTYVPAVLAAGLALSVASLYGAGDTDGASYRSAEGAWAFTTAVVFLGAALLLQRAAHSRWRCTSPAHPGGAGLDPGWIRPAAPQSAPPPGVNPHQR